MSKKDSITCMPKTTRKVSLAEYAEKHNPRKNRRGFPMSESYLYRLIRETEAGIRTSKQEVIWFNYVMEGDKNHIYILIDK